MIKTFRVDFVDEVGDSWEEYVVFHHRFKQWMEVNGYDTDDQLSHRKIWMRWLKNHLITKRLPMM